LHMHDHTGDRGYLQSSPSFQKRNGGAVVLVAMRFGDCTSVLPPLGELRSGIAT